MGTLISIAIIIVCLLLIMIVLVQNSKGGGLASSFSSSNQVMGVRKTGDFLEKATWSLAAALLLLSLLSAYNKPTATDAAGNNTSKTQSVTRREAENHAAPAAPNAAAPAVPGATVPPPAQPAAPGTK